MDIEQLRLFVAVARTGSISQAADEMHLTQSAGSQSIARLEKEIGALLFLREKKQLILKESGERFYRHVIHILQELENACAELTQSEEEISGIIRLQVFAASALMPRLLSEFSALYPEVRYQMIQHNKNSDYDLCINYVSDDGIPSGADLLLDEEVQIAVPLSHPLAVRKSVYLRDLQHDNFILMRTGTVLRKLSDRVCHQAGFEPRVVFESDNPFAVRSMISLGLGVAFFPQVSWSNSIDSHNIALLHIINPPCHRQLCIYPWLKHNNTKAVEAFRKYALMYFDRTRKAVLTKA